jgi:hypothetical protein
MHFLDPIPTSDLEKEDVKQLREHVYELMWNYIESRK